MKKNSGGYTLIELLVTVACSSLVLFAAMGFLMVCMRLDVSAQDTASRQGTARMVLSLLENVTTDGQVTKLETVGDDWILWGTAETEEDSAAGVVLLQYSGTGGALVTGSGTVLMDGLTGSAVTWEGDKKLLTVELDTQEGDYTTAVYCRTAIEVPQEVTAADLLDEVPVEATLAGRYHLLQILAGEYDSTGSIQNPADGETYSYYSEWYIGGYEDHPGWNENTPWCACFLSWAVDQLEERTLSVVPRFADVDAGMESFRSGDYGVWLEPRGEEGPLPGDFIFFDWEGGDDPEHAGAVLLVRDSRVYTIEGNSGGRVAVRSYALTDPRIVGYGRLEWAAPEDGTGADA